MTSAISRVLAFALVAGCSHATPEPPRDFTAVQVPCIVPIGQAVEDGGPPQTDDWIGPQACARALELYLRAHPAIHVGNIVPILAPPPAKPSPSAIVHRGTQSLFVQQAPDGPWPTADRLAVRVVTCPLASGSDDVDCARGLGSAKQTGILAWVPINTEGPNGSAAYTREILYVYQAR